MEVRNLSNWRLLLVVVAFVGVAVAAFGATGADDSFITFDASRALVASGRLVNGNGDLIEQSTSILLVLAIAVGHVVTGLQIPVVGWLLSLAGGVLVLVATYLIARRFRPELAIPATISMALVPNILYWSLSGMEMTLAAAAVLFMSLGIDSTDRGRRAAIVAVVLIGLALFLLRPEQGALALASAVLVLGALCVRRRNRPIPPRGALTISAIALFAAVMP